MKKIRDVSLVFLRRRTDGIDQVCLAMKKRGFGAGRFNGQGGKPEEAEAIDVCARREVFEEVGVRVSGLDKVAEIEFRFPHNEQWDQLVHVYLSSDWTGEPEESDEMRPEWFAVDKLPFNEMWPADVRWLPSVLEGKKIVGKCIFGEGEVVRDFVFREVDGFDASN